MLKIKLRKTCGAGRMGLVSVAAAVALSVVIALSVITIGSVMAEPTFTSYQGLLEKDGEAYTGTADMKFVIVDLGTGASLWSNDGSSVDGSEPTATVSVSVGDGIFTVFLGMSPMTPLVPEDLAGSDEPVLRVWVDTGDGFEQLDDQPVGGALYGVAGTAGEYWSLTGNAGSTPGTDYLGTSDETGLRIKVGGHNILRFEPTGEDGGIHKPGNIIGGRSNNTVRDGAIGATISGGGNVDEPNKVTDDFGTVGGGRDNIAGNENSSFVDSQGATVGGGQNNEAREQYSTIGGGYTNKCTGFLGTIAGGYINEAYNYATVGGGRHNAATGNQATIAGGWENIASGDVSTVPGGFYATASGDYSFAAGYKAKAMGEGSFVWADNSGEDFLSNGPNSFSIRASGGVNIADSAGERRIKLNPESGTIRTELLVITGGTDLAEPFVMSDSKPLPEGSVVVIDEEHPGQLMMSIRAYDHRVAGIISGAGGIRAGLMLQQEECVGDAQHVALTGRAYVMADASRAPIQPGDLLTTSNTPGHAMVATDTARRSGAVIGKAMSSLDCGTGLVLVLISLQ